MFLDEIHKSPQHSVRRLQLTDVKFNTKILIGPAEGWLNIYKVKTKDPTAYIYYLANENKSDDMLSYVMGIDYTLHGTQYFIIGDAFTSENNQKKGYASALYYSLVKKYNVKILSDKAQTPHGKALWDNLRKKISAKIINVSTGEIYPDDNTITQDELYTNDGIDKYRLVLEDTIYEQNTSTIPNVGIGILRPYLMFTADDDTGKYE